MTSVSWDLTKVVKLRNGVFPQSPNGCLRYCVQLAVVVFTQPGEGSNTYSWFENVVAV